MAWRPPLVGGEPAEPARTYVLWGAAVLVALQLVVPATYYGSSDPYDERFSWRMFSAVRVHRCSTVAFDVEGSEERPIDLVKTIHRAWIGMLSRNRADVVEAFLAHRCDTASPDAVRVRTFCMAPDETRVPDIVWERDCASGEVDAPEIRLEPEVSEEAGTGGEP